MSGGEDARESLIEATPKTMATTGSGRHIANSCEVSLGTLFIAPPSQMIAARGKPSTPQIIDNALRIFMVSWLC